jgi:hypothetical protein
MAIFTAGTWCCGPSAAIYEYCKGAALKIQQCIPFVFVRHVAINKVKVLSVAMEKQQLALLSSYKIF